MIFVVFLPEDDEKEILTKFNSFLKNLKFNLELENLTKLKFHDILIS